MWTIIRVSVAGGYFYDAVEGAVNPALDLDFGDDGYIEAGSYEIVLQGLSEDEMDKFMNMSAGEREAVYILNKIRPS